MANQWFLKVAAPQSGIGWVMRLLAIAALSLALLAIPSTLIDGYFWAHVPLALLIGMPFGFAMLLALSKLECQTRQVANYTTVDGLTGVANRTHFIRRTARNLNQSGVLLHVDIDEFRTVNDRRGREAGDRCLLALAIRFRELTRASDIVGRLDNATFGLYLPGAPVERARDIADRLCAGVQVVSDETAVSVTISVGAVLADGQTPLDKLMRDADQALARAKVEGRGKVIVNELSLVA